MSAAWMLYTIAKLSRDIISMEKLSSSCHPLRPCPDPTVSNKGTSVLLPSISFPSCISQIHLFLVPQADIRQDTMTHSSQSGQLGWESRGPYQEPNSTNFVFGIKCLLWSYRIICRGNAVAQMFSVLRDKWWKWQNTGTRNRKLEKQSLSHCKN